MLYAIIAGVVLIVLGLVTGHDALWQIGIGATAGGLIRMYYISGRERKN